MLITEKYGSSLFPETDQKHEESYFVKVDLMEILVYVSELTFVDGLVINPYTKLMCINHEMIRILLIAINTTQRELK